MNKPTVILATVKNIIYIYYIVFDLIEHQIPLFYIHLMIFIRWNIRFFEERKFMWHILQRTYCFYQLFLFFNGRFFIDLCDKTDVHSEHLFCLVRNNYFILSISHMLHLCNYRIQICFQVIKSAAFSSSYSFFFNREKFFP